MNDSDDTVCVEMDGLAIEIAISPAAGALDVPLAQTIAAAIHAANDTIGPVQGNITVLVDGDERIRELNKRWRGLDKPTNVLSFPYPDAPPGPSRYVGDIAMSYETAAQEAAAESKPLADHVAHLSVHGFLHLLGYDHIEDGEATRMEQLERDILARLGLPDPYIAHETEG